MTIERIARICFCIVFVIVVAPAVAVGQGNEKTGQDLQGPGWTVIERNHAGGAASPWRLVQTRSGTGSREVVVETLETPNIEGRLTPSLEVVEETIRTAPDTAQTRRDVFGFAGDQRRRLLESHESLRESLANGNIRAVHISWAQDSNGRLGLMSRQIEQTSSASADVRRTDTTLWRPGINEVLRETARTEHVERQIDPGVVRYDTTRLIRDINGRWQPTETRRGDSRQIGASEHIEEETVERWDTSKKLAVDERNVTRRSSANGQDYEVIQTYVPYAEGFSRSSSLALSQQVRRTTTTNADGSQHTVEEIEGRSPVAPSDPMRLTRRTVTTVRPIRTDRWITERQVFERDVNGRLQLVINETEDRTGR
jgi:hypothetical protein